MNKNVRIEKGYIKNRVVAYLFDICISAITYLLLELIILNAVFVPFFNFNNNKDEIALTLKEYNLDYSDDLDYTEYESVIQDFYFVKFTNEIIEDYKIKYKETYTIEHIYNVLVLGLSTSPTLDSYSTSLYKYEIDEDGNFLVDKIGTRIEGSGSNYEKNLRDLFLTTYNKLSDYLRSYLPSFNKIYSENQLYLLINRSISITLSFIIFYLIIPLTNKYGSTLFERIFDIAHINIKNGYLVKKYKIILKSLINYIIPIIGIILGTTYSIVILTIGFLFLNFLDIVVSKNNLDLGEMILRIETASIKESLLFKDKNEENNYIEEHKSEIEAKDISLFNKTNN